MGKCLLVERRMVLPYDTIEGQNVVTGNLSCLLLFLFLSILKTTKKSINTYFRLCKPVRITAHKSWIQHKNNKYQEKVGY